MKIDGIEIGKTPVTKKMPREFGGGSMTVTFEMDGYKTKTMTKVQDFDTEFACVGCAVSLVLIVPLIFHLPWSYRYEPNIFVSLERE